MVISESTFLICVMHIFAELHLSVKLGMDKNVLVIYKGVQNYVSASPFIGVNNWKWIFEYGMHFEIKINFSTQCSAHIDVLIMYRDAQEKLGTFQAVNHNDWNIFFQMYYAFSKFFIRYIFAHLSMVKFRYSNFEES